jgi:hypothetical protein
MIELFGEQVIPNFDSAPEHSTAVYRRGAAGPKYPPYNNPVDPTLRHTVLPPAAIIPLPE